MPILKFNKIILSEIQDDEINKYIMSKTDIKNCLVTYCLSSIFKLSNSNTVSMNLIERCFPMFADSGNFLELGFTFIRKILLSSGLNVDSELQIFNAVDSWLCHSITERSKYAKELLSVVRFPLLAIPALKQILDRVLSMYHECASNIEAVLVKKQQFISFSPNITNRYCKQINFKVLICGGRTCTSFDSKFLTDIKLFDTNNFSDFINFSSKKEDIEDYFGAVCIKGEVFVFGGIAGETQTIEKYSSDTNTWEYVADMIDDRVRFSICSFMNNVYIMSGHSAWPEEIRHIYTATCFKFDTKSLDWKEISRMNNGRIFSASSVFEGRIIVSGGKLRRITNTVVAYDHVGDTWENMPNMINGRAKHKSVAAKNKFFVIGGFETSSCEVFDSITNEFTLLKQPSLLSVGEIYRPSGVITIGSEIFVFQDNSGVKTYDFENNEWSLKMCEATKGISRFTVLKYL